MSLFPNRFPQHALTAAWSAHSDLVWSRVYACLGVTCHLHLWQNDQGLLHATAVTRGWNVHRLRVSTQSLTPVKKILPPLLPGFEFATFLSRVRRSYRQASRRQCIPHSYTVKSVDRLDRSAPSGSYEKCIRGDNRSTRECKQKPKLELVRLIIFCLFVCFCSF